MRRMHPVVISAATVCLLTLLLSSTSISAPSGPEVAPLTPAQLQDTVAIDANSLLMFVTNRGGFGRDVSDLFGYDYGTFYPYFGRQMIESGSQISSPLYAAGLWLGGIVDGEERVAIAEYGLEYVPGPMADSTFQADRPDYRFYMLHQDSLASNPNADYLDWPTAGSPERHQRAAPDARESNDLVGLQRR